MYNPKVHEETRIDVLHQLVRAHPLGTLVMVGEGELVANPIPFLIDRTRGEFGTLMAHISRANNVWKMPISRIPALVCFQGAQAYITPNWYPSKADTGKAVPTWNYVVVQAQGVPQFIHDRDWLLAHVDELTREHEAGQPLPWHVQDAPADYIDRLVSGIVGIEIPLQSLTGKWKTSQNRPEVDKHGIIAGLHSRGHQQDIAVADLVKSHINSEK